MPLFITMIYLLRNGGIKKWIKDFLWHGASCSGSWHDQGGSDFKSYLVYFRPVQRCCDRNWGRTTNWELRL